MTKQEKLYEVLGELLYAVAMADGIIQPEEEDALNALLQKHTWASEIKWSFDYEAGKNASVEEAYEKALNFCHGYGPTPVYEEFIDAMKFIAKASNGIDPDESHIIHSFSKDLIARFQRDLDRR